MAIRTWKIGEHHIEIKYPSYGWGFSATVKVDGKIYDHKAHIFGHPKFSFTLGKQKVEINWSSWTSYADPICRVDGILQKPEITEKFPLIAYGLLWLGIILFVIFIFILWAIS